MRKPAPAKRILWRLSHCVQEGHKACTLGCFLRDFTELHVDEFRVFGRSVEVEMCNFYSHETSTNSGDDAVKQNLGDKHICCGHGNCQLILSPPTSK